MVMKKVLRDKVEILAKDMAEAVVEHNVNSNCWFIFHQETPPKGSERFKKNM